MKHIKRCLLLLSIIVLGAITNTSFGQCVINTTTTDWQQYNGGNGPSNNDFNWTTSGLSYPIYLQDNLDNPSRNIELPYFCTQSSGSGSCGNDNTLHYELLGNSAAQQDINPKDGWELVLKNFGTPNLTSGDNTGRGVANPFFVLYNRYNGKMKFFLALTGIRTGSSALLRIGFLQSQKYTALFSHAEPIAKVLNKFDNTLEFNTINHIAQKNFQDDYYWLVSEIQTAYDPCACFRPLGNTAPSVIVVTPYVISTSDIELKIDGTFSGDLILNNSVVPEADKKTSFLDLGKAALSSYNKWDSYKTKANSFLTNYNQEYKDGLVNDWWKEEIRKNPTLAGTLTSTQINQLFDDFKSTDEGFKKMMGIDKIDKYNNDFGVLKGIASTLPYVGTAIGIIDFFSQGGKEDESEPAPPTVFNVNLTANGSITTATPLTNFAFHNPGTIDPNNPSASHLTPFYDNVLGVVNILKAPDFSHHTITPVRYLDNFVPNRVPSYPEGDWTDALAANIKQYKITEDVKYAINPAANLEVSLIDACFVFEYTGADNLFIKDPNDFASSAAIPFYYDLHKDNNAISFEDRMTSMENSGTHLDFLSANYPSGGASSKIRFRTQYVPLKCLPNVNFLLFGTNTPKTYIRLLVRMKRTDDPSAAAVTQIITYDVTDKFTSSVENTSTNSTYDAHLYAGTIKDGGATWVYEDVVYSGFKQNGLPLDNIYLSQHDVTYDPNIHTGNLNATGDITIPNYTNIPDGTVIRAFGKIIIGGSVTFGNNVELRSGETIDIPSTTVINPTTQLIIEPNINLTAFNCTSSDVISLKATQTEIDAICNSTDYKDNAGFAKNDPTEFDDNTANKVPITDCHIYPNPTTSNIYISLQLEKEVAYDIKIMDVQGKDLISRQYSGKLGKNIEGIDVSSLPAGVYFINIITENYQKTDKFLVIR